jgi:hypothetical protein
MASVSSGFGPKLRSRKHGAATPLDDPTSACST